MALRIRRGTESQRTGQIFNSGEIVWTTDLQQLWVGDGVAQGGVPAVGLNITGYGLTYNNTSHKIEVSGLTTDDITQISGANNRWFTTELAQDAVAPMFTGGTHTNISFQYDDALGKINATVTLDGAGINALQDDTTPTLGGNLILNGFNVTGTGDINITGDIDVTGTITGNSLDTNDANIGTLTFSGVDSTLTTTNSVPIGFVRSDAPIYIGTNAVPTTLWIKSDNNFAVLTGLTDGTNTSGLSIKQSRGTLATPATLIAGDPVVFCEGFAYNGTEYVASGAFGLSTDPDWNGVNGTAGQIPSQFGAVVLDKSGNVSILQFNSQGVLNVPIFKATGYATGSLPVAIDAGQEGYIVFDSTTKQFKGWNGSAWVVLG